MRSLRDIPVSSLVCVMCNVFVCVGAFGDEYASTSSPRAPMFRVVYLSPLYLCFRLSSSEIPIEPCFLAPEPCSPPDHAR